MTTTPQSTALYHRLWTLMRSPSCPLANAKYRMGLLILERLKGRP